MDWISLWVPPSFVCSSTLSFLMSMIILLKVMRSKQGCVSAEISLVMIFCSAYLNLKNVIGLAHYIINILCLQEIIGALLTSQIHEDYYDKSQSSQINFTF